MKCSQTDGVEQLAICEEDMSATSSQILYGLVCYGRVVLCDCYLVSGSFESLCQSALDYVEASRTKRAKKKTSYKDKQRNVRVCVYRSQGMNYMAVGHKSYKKTLIYSSLVRVEKAFLESGLHKLVKTATPYSMRYEFRADLRSILSEEEAAPGRDSGDKKGSRVADGALGKVHEVKKAVALRGNKLNQVEKHSEDLWSGAAEYDQLATQLRKKTEAKNQSQKAHEVKKAVAVRGDKLNQVEKHSEDQLSGAAEYDQFTQMRKKTEARHKKQSRLCCCFC